MKTVKTPACVIGAGALVIAASGLGAGDASAARQGDLWVQATAICDDGKAFRMVAVMNVGDAEMTGVRVGTVGGPEITVPYIKEPNIAADTANRYVNGVPVVSATGTSAAGTLAPGEQVIAAHVVPGCGPYGLVGYAKGDRFDDVLSAPNYAMEFANAPAPAAPR
ncbi:MAG: hypothetical protein QM809_02065 [Gordonia sp. (in: high G+C Gram-positive bacteria)]|uniref:hypothetical protein n=1 Tax=Gordonia sp. (in: high G+C Gram-positive bacteria) TaxID=84139 RepID=UPI0039E26C76